MADKIACECRIIWHWTFNHTPFTKYMCSIILQRTESVFLVFVLPNVGSAIRAVVLLHQAWIYAVWAWSTRPTTVEVKIQIISISFHFKYNKDINFQDNRFCKMEIITFQSYLHCTQNSLPSLPLWTFWYIFTTLKKS